MRKVRNLVLVILLAGLLVFPVAAQEATPEAPAPEGDITITVEQPPADPGVLENVARDWGVLIIATIALIVIGFVARSGIVAAAAGVPPEVFDTAIYGVERGLDVLDRGAIVTPTPLDNAAIAELRRLIADLAKQVEENRITSGAQTAK